MKACKFQICNNCEFTNAHMDWLSNYSVIKLMYRGLIGWYFWSISPYEITRSNFNNHFSLTLADPEGWLYLVRNVKKNKILFWSVAKKQTAKVVVRWYFNLKKLDVPPNFRVKEILTIMFDLVSNFSVIFKLFFILKFEPFLTSSLRF